ncbi:MAG: DUF424 family protein [Methanobacteriota archaeon]
MVQTQSENLVVICDKELLGKKFKDRKLKIEVKETFYRGNEASVEKCIDALRNATIANMLGSTVECAVEAGIVNRSSVLDIKGVKHAQIVRL